MEGSKGQILKTYFPESFPFLQFLNHSLFGLASKSWVWSSPRKLQFKSRTEISLWQMWMISVWSSRKDSLWQEHCRKKWWAREQVALFILFGCKSAQMPRMSSWRWLRESWTTGLSPTVSQWGLLMWLRVVSWWSKLLKIGRQPNKFTTAI